MLHNTCLSTEKFLFNNLLRINMLGGWRPVFAGAGEQTGIPNKGDQVKTKQRSLCQEQAGAGVDKAAVDAPEGR
jgi:hypothetical protein